jgi:microcystin-dependent protein
MEGTMSEIRLFGGNFEPRSWAFCNGQTLAISTNQALFALLGTTYGGNGVQTFMLPDLRGRTVVGTGQGLGLSPYSLGEPVGTNDVTLISQQMAAHIHATVVTQPTSRGTGTATLYGVNSGNGQAQPGGNYLSNDTTGGAKPYVHPGTGSTVQLSDDAITAANLNVPPPTVTTALTGGNQPHNNIMPSIALNYIICLQGIFPSRD